MKANELMIGDLVLWGESVSDMGGDYDIHWEERRLSINDFATMVEEDWDDRTVDEFVKPIPITDEILEKNGFLMRKSACHFKHYMWTTRGIDHYADVYVEVGRDQQDNWRWDCLHFKLNFCGGEVFLMKMHYVHELQHALRLCKIEKEIEL